MTFTAYIISHPKTIFQKNNPALSSVNHLTFRINHGANDIFCTPAEYRTWLQCMMGIYPIQSYLHRINRAASPSCQPEHCMSSADDTLTHFACVCPKYREARTSAHNQIRRVVTSFLRRVVGPRWVLHEETRLARTGLIIRPIPAELPDADPSAPRPVDALPASRDLGRWQPDWILVSKSLRRIAIVEIGRAHV